MGVRHTDWDDPIRDDELPDEIDLEDGDTPALVPCPACRELIADDADRCHHCGEWITQWSPATERAMGWLWPVAVAVLIAMILLVWRSV